MGSNNNDPHAQILQLFPELFSGVGCLDTMYRIDLKSDAQPVKHAARRVPESIRPKVKEELDRLVKDGIIKRVECPTDWVNSIVCVSKPNGNIRLCLDQGWPVAFTGGICHRYLPVNTGVDNTPKSGVYRHLLAFINISLISLQITLLTVLATYYIIHGHHSTIFAAYA